MRPSLHTDDVIPILLPGECILVCTSVNSLYVSPRQQYIIVVKREFCNRQVCFQFYFYIPFSFARLAFFFNVLCTVLPWRWQWCETCAYEVSWRLLCWQLLKIIVAMATVVMGDTCVQSSLASQTLSGEERVW